MAGRGEVLLRLARDEIGAALQGRTAAAAEPVPAEPWLAEPGAAFVTLTTRDGRLRGCIGSLEAWRPLADDVRANARAAAFRDPRFPPLQADELPGIRVEVSVLSEPRPLDVADEADAAARLRPGVDGVILAADGRRGTYLPQVWEQLPEPAAFLRSLKRKAGLPESGWGPEARLWVYTVEKYEEEGP